MQLINQLTFNYLNIAQNGVHIWKFLCYRQAAALSLAIDQCIVM